MATPVANLGISYCIQKGVKDPDLAWFNPFHKKLFEETASQIVGKNAAITFLDLATDCRIPSWVGQHVDIELIRAAAIA